MNRALVRSAIPPRNHSAFSLWLYQRVRNYGVSASLTLVDSAAPSIQLEPAWLPERASRWRRLLAYLIDTGVIAVLALLTNLLLPKSDVWLVLLAAYSIASAGWENISLGKRLLGLKIVDANNGNPLKLSRRGARGISILIISLVPFVNIGLMFGVLIDRRARGFHDHIAGSIVTHD